MLNQWIYSFMLNLESYFIKKHFIKVKPTVSFNQDVVDLC